MNTNETWLMPVSKDSEQSGHDKITEALANGRLKPGDYLPSEGRTCREPERELLSGRPRDAGSSRVRNHKGRGCIRTTIDSMRESMAYQLILQSNTSHEKLVEFRRVIESTVSVWQ
ncbi:MAG: hypothetical protein ACLVJO_08985 [[Clostridium] scindens]